MNSEKINRALAAFRQETTEHNYFSNCSDEKIRQLIESAFTLQPMGLLTVRAMQERMSLQYGEGIKRSYYGAFNQFLSNMRLKNI